MAIRVLGPKANFLAIGRNISAFETSRIVVLPVPYEHTVSYGAGAKNGPAAILRASAYVEFYDEELDRELCSDVGIATLPPLHFGKKTDARALDQLKRVTGQLIDGGKFVVILGGEHTISSAPIGAFAARYPALSILHIDAHSDLRDSYEGNKYSHASVMARVCETLDPARLVQVGIRAQSIEEAHFIEEKGVKTFFAYQMRGMGGEFYPQPWEDLVLEQLSEDVYISFDVDGLDPSIMPSTGTPEPNGLLWAETMRLLRRVGEEKRIVGCDVVELAPIKGLTYPNLSAARLVYKMMNYAFAKENQG